MSLDMVSFAPALKELYGPQKIQNTTYQDHPLLALMPKFTGFKGKVMPEPIIYGDPQNRSADFSVAVAGTSSSELKSFILTRVKDYSIASIDNETMMASEGDNAAFLQALTTEMDGAMHSISRSLAIAVWGTGSGSIGRISTTTTLASTSLVLSDAEQVVNFEVGQIIVLSATDGGGTVKAGQLEVVAVNRDSGVITTDVNISTGVATAALSDYVFIKGDYDAKLKGVQAWIPNVAPTSTPFFSVDRSTDTTRLGGIRFDGSALPIEEALNKAAARLAREGGKPDYCFLSYSKWAELENALGSKVQYIDLKANAEVGFRGIQINGPRGPIKVVADQDCPSNRAFLLDMKTWKLNSLGDAPQLLDSDGNKMLREANADAVQIRIGYYAQVSCNAPGRNANILLS